MTLSIWIALGLMLLAGALLAVGTYPKWKKYVDQDGDGEFNKADLKILADRGLAEAKKAADANKDGKLDMADAKNIADLNHDGKVDEKDLNIAKVALKDAAKKVNAVVGAKKP